jgi:hypothetical protein
MTNYNCSSSSTEEIICTGDKKLKGSKRAVISNGTIRNRIQELITEN